MMLGPTIIVDAAVFIMYVDLLNFPDSLDFRNVDFHLCFPLQKPMGVGRLHLVTINDLLPHGLVWFFILMS